MSMNEKKRAITKVEDVEESAPGKIPKVDKTQETDDKAPDQPEQGPQDDSHIEEEQMEPKSAGKDEDYVAEEDDAPDENDDDIPEDELEEDEEDVLEGQETVLKETTTEPSKVKGEYKLSANGDEYELEIDPKGEEKIDGQGNLKGGRKFRIATFTLSDRDNRLFMLATKVARILGLRDSHNLFTKSPMLHKIPLTTKDKFELIDKKVLPLSYKGRSINVITARSVFVVYGAKVIESGKKVTDDYYEQKAIDRGDRAGEPAFLEHKNIFSTTSFGAEANNALALNGANNNYNANVQNLVTNVSAIDMNSKFLIRSNIAKTIVTEENWMLTHALASKQLDYDCSYERIRFWNLKVVPRDPYTGIKFYPLTTQSKKVRWSKIKVLDDGTHKVEDKPVYIKSEPSSGKISYETVIHCPDLTKTTGLINVGKEIFDDVVTPEVKEAILQQQKLEKQVSERT